MYNIVHTVGTRPNFIKAAPVVKALSNISTVTQKLIHTGQHYSTFMSDVFFEELTIPSPDINLNVLPTQSHAKQTADIMVRIEDYLIKFKPDNVFVYGDVNSTLAAAIVAVKLNIPVTHIEAGLRSNDKQMPEEINRIVVDQLSTYHFVTESSAKANLLRENWNNRNVFFVGNTMIDTLLKHVDNNVKTRNQLLITCHRQSNVDNKFGLKKLIDIIVCAVQYFENVVFPIHPRTLKNLKKFNLYDELKKYDNITLELPMSYINFIRTMQASMMVLTDSGGIQEETTTLKIPCLTLRKNTERPCTITYGTNILIDTVHEAEKYFTRITTGQYFPFDNAKMPKLWDGNAAQRIAHIVEEKIVGTV